MSCSDWYYILCLNTNAIITNLSINRKEDENINYHGPNLNLLHKRDSQITGIVEEIEENRNKIARNLNLSINFVQSNDEVRSWLIFKKQ